MDPFFSTDEILNALNVAYPEKVIVEYSREEDYERTETNYLKFFNVQTFVDDLRKMNFSLSRKARDPTFHVDIKFDGTQVIIKGPSVTDTYTFITTSIAKQVYDSLYVNGS